MSLTRYRAAPPRVMVSRIGLARPFGLPVLEGFAFCGPAGASRARVVLVGRLEPRFSYSTTTIGRFEGGPLVFPVVAGRVIVYLRMMRFAFCRPGSDLLSRALRQSTIGAGAFHGRVRNGNGCSHPARTT